MIDESNIFQALNSITIGEYTYSLKAALKGNNYSYRCKYRSKCHVIINIKKIDLIKKNNENN